MNGEDDCLIMISDPFYEQCTRCIHPWSTEASDVAQIATSRTLLGVCVVRCLDPSSCAMAMRMRQWSLQLDDVERIVRLFDLTHTL